MYKEYNDYEILYMISENDDDTYELLFKKYKPLIIKYANKYKKSFKKYGYELEDIMQIGYISLYKASRKYKYYSENMFYTFLIKLLDNDYNNEYHKCNSNKQKSLNESVSYNSFIKNTDILFLDVIGQYEYDFENSIQTINDFINFKNNLPLEIACVLELKINGYKNSEIKKLLDINDEEFLDYIRVIKSSTLYT